MVPLGDVAGSGDDRGGPESSVVSHPVVVPRVLAGLIILGATQAACRQGICPTIGCQPEVTLAYRQPITSPYHVVVSLHGVTIEGDCPLDRSYPTIGIQNCSAQGLVVTGVDLGHGANETVDLTVSIDSGATLAVTATLDGIGNSRDCDVVCYQHQGTVPN
jgi:hypothetical protein